MRTIPQHGQTCPECGNAAIRTRSEIDGKRYRVCSGKGSCGSSWLLPRVGQKKLVAFYDPAR